MGYFIFYSDTHDVDEDLRAIIKQGDMWRAGTNGLFMRALDSTGDALGHVASVCSFKCGCVYITTLIVNELIGDNGVKESIVH